MHKKSIVTSIAAMTLMMGLAACQKTDESTGKGPAEAAGAKLDVATAKAREKLNEVGEVAGQALQKAGEKSAEALKKGGEKLESASKEAQKND